MSELLGRTHAGVPLELRPAADPCRRPVGAALFRELFDEVASLETKFKTVRTLRRLAIPGCLTR
jgi:hypothetical protein